MNPLSRGQQKGKGEERVSVMVKGDKGLVGEEEKIVGPCVGFKLTVHVKDQVLTHDAEREVRRDDRIDIGVS